MKTKILLLAILICVLILNTEAQKVKPRSGELNYGTDYIYVNFRKIKNPEIKIDPYFGKVDTDYEKNNNGRKSRIRVKTNLDNKEREIFFVIEGKNFKETFTFIQEGNHYSLQKISCTDTLFNLEFPRGTELLFEEFNIQITPEVNVLPTLPSENSDNSNYLTDFLIIIPENNSSLPRIIKVLKLVNGWDENILNVRLEPLGIIVQECPLKN